MISTMSNMPMTIPGLTALVNSGDKESNEMVYEQLGDWMHKSAVRIIGFRIPRHDFDDVFQNVYVELLETPWPDQKIFLRAFYKRLGWRTLDVLREHARREKPFDSDGFGDILVRCKSPHEVAQDAEELKLLLEDLDAIESQDEQLANCLRMRIFGGHSYQEIGDVYGIPRQTVSHRVRISLAHLRTKFSVEADEV